MKFEKAVPADAEELLRLQKCAYQSEAEIYNDFTIPPLIQTLEELRKDFCSSNFYVVRENNSIAASINLRIDGYTGYVGRVVVTPEKQGKGIGSFLMDEVEKQFSGLKRLELFTGHLSVRNLAIYSHKGYKEFRSEIVTQNLKFIYLEKEL